MIPLQWAGLADAYLEWAQHSRFAFVHTRFAQEAGVLIETAAGTIEPREVRLLPDRTLDCSALTDVRRVELAAPIVKRDKLDITGMESGRPIDTVLGVIDDGCPFARGAFMQQQRVAYWWQQGAWKGSGQQMNAAQLQKLYQSAGRDDALTYEKLALTHLRRRATHGAHVLDVFAGPVPPRSRVSPSRMRGEGADGSAHLPPPWNPANDTASRAPVVLVQLPQEAIEDPTGRWLGRYVLEGVDFILQAANKLMSPRPAAVSGLPRVVVNISWGPQTGPHDGSSLLERALLQRVTSGREQGLDLQLVLPAGNSHEARAHAQWVAHQGCPALHWQAMPDADHPQFLEVWWPANTDIHSARITVTAPDGSTAANHDTHGPGQHGVFDSAAGWWLVVVPHAGTDGCRQMALLALAPTRPAAGRDSAPHGRWTVSVAAATERHDNEAGHVYVARNSANMNGSRRSSDSYLYDPAYEATRHGRWPRQEPDTSLVRREGTLSGITTGPGVTVVGGYVLGKGQGAADRAAPYTSSGARSGGRKPDWSQPSDESSFLRGIRAGGVREGTSIRLVGTSTAAPQLARKLANRDPLLPPGQRGASGPSTPPAPPPDPRLGTPLPMQKNTDA